MIWLIFEALPGAGALRVRHLVTLPRKPRRDKEN